MSHKSPSYSVTIRLRYPDEPGQLGTITSAVGQEDGLIGAVDIVNVHQASITRDVTVSASSVAHGHRIVDRLKQLQGIEVLNVSDRTFLLHLGGKIEIHSKVPVKTRDDLSMAYTPGVARICDAIASDPESAFNLTIKRNTVAIVTDGSAVLGLGNIGPMAALPVMEGKALLFKEFAGVDAFPICLDTQNVGSIVHTCEHISPVFGGINLEDISAPRCIEIEERLQSELDIPVFHDDQHGTAIVVLAALQNAVTIVGKQLEDLRVTLSGAGAAGTAIAKLLSHVGVGHIVVCDRAGAIHQGRSANMNSSKQWLAKNTNPEKVAGPLGHAITGADAFIGVSAANVVAPTDIKRMGRDPIVFALANPDPEVSPEEAIPHVAVMATGRSDYPNQINNVLCFPGFFRGMLDVRAGCVTEGMKVAAANAIASVIQERELRPDYIVPSVFDRRVAKAVASAAASAAHRDGVARRDAQSGSFENDQNDG